MFLQIYYKILNDISEKNKDYSDTLHFRKEGGGGTFFILEVLDYKSAMWI